MKVELRKNSLIVTGTNRRGRYDFSYVTCLYFTERGWPLPEEAQKIVDAKMNLEVPDLSGIRWRRPPWPHQEAGVKKWLTVKRGALYHAMGAGKSAEALAGTGWLFEKGLARRALIVCPLSVYAEWPRQFTQHATEGSLHIIRDVKKGRKLLPGLPEKSIVLINYEKLKSLEAELTGFADVIVADEATKIKNPSAQRTKILARLARESKYVLIMTGTPVSKNLIDVFGEFMVMDPFWFGRSFWMFKQRYCQMGGYLGHQIVGYQREDELRKIINFPSHRVTKAEALPDLPPKVYEERVCEMAPEQRKLYKSTQRKFWVEFSGGAIDIKNAAARIVKLQEIANGFIITDTRETVDLPNPKLEILSETFEEVDEDERVVVWCRFRHDIEKIDTMLGAKFPSREVFQIHGDVKDREGAIANLRITPGSVLICQIQTGGMGIDLTCSHLAFVYSGVFEYALREQMEDRHHRPGQPNAVTYVDFITEDTVDRRVQKVLESKKTLAEWLMEDRGRLSDIFDPSCVYRG